jgi:hypothetical protein
MTGRSIAALARKLAAVTLLLAVAGLVYLLALSPIEARLRSASEAISEQRMLLGRLRGEIARRSGGQRNDEAAALPDRVGDVYLQGESDAVKAARLQAMLKEIAEAAGLRLASTRALPLRQAGRLRLIGMEARLDAGMAGLQKLLLALEASRPVVLVHALAVSPSASRSFAADAERVVEDELLSIAIEVQGAAPLGAGADAPGDAGPVDAADGEVRREPAP